MVYCCLKNNSKDIKFSCGDKLVGDGVGSCDGDTAPTTYPYPLFPISPVNAFAAAITIALT